MSYDNSIAAIVAVIGMHDVNAQTSDPSKQIVRVWRLDGDQANNDSLASGAVYAFTRSGTTWRQHAYLKASNPAQAASFGWSVALAHDGGVLAVGSIGEAGTASLTANKATSAPKVGAVYVFGRHSNAWAQDAYVKVTNADAGDQFGYAVALSRDGRTLAVCAGGESSAATGAGGDRLDNSCIGSGADYVY